MSSANNGCAETITDIVVNSVDIDEGIDGCLRDSPNMAEGLSAGPHLKIDPQPVGMLKSACPKSAKDSGFSSRVSEVDGDRAHHSLLEDNHSIHERDLTKRLTWMISEDRVTCNASSVVKAIVKVLGVVALLYTFICTLDLLSNAFRLLGGKTAGSVFSDSKLLGNPITGLMIGVLATVILQSSSTSSSIVITMVASKIIDIRPAIPIIMGANIGTTVTNTLVSLAHSMDRKEFRRAFSGAVIHDVFNWLTVLILLPLEFSTGYLYHLTNAIVSSMNLEDMKTKKQDLLKKITKPLTSRIVQVDKKVITGIAEGKEGYANKSLLKVYCVFDKVEEYKMVNVFVKNNTHDSWELVNKTITTKIPVEKCESLLSVLDMGDTTSGIILFLTSILLLSFCLFFLVKLLHSLLGGHIAKAARKTINADFPKPFSWLTGYVAILVGAGMTILVQSSSVFTSALTPLVGVGCLKLERMYPLTLGSNIGTTGTGILAALASSSATMPVALQLALCHLFFNISGIMLFYPVPKMRNVIFKIAKHLGRTTAKYRWFAVVYLFFMFLVFPGALFGLSFAGKIAFITVLCIAGFIAVSILVISLLQKSRFSYILPTFLKTWKFLPEPMRSLAPLDRLMQSILYPCSKYCCQCCLNKCKCMNRADDFDAGSIDSDSDYSSVESSRLSSSVSSKVMLNSSTSNNDLKGLEARKIYKPKNGKRSNGSAMADQEAAANASPLLFEERKTPRRNSPNKLSIVDESDAIVINIPSINVDDLRESKI